jgi:D-alanyl-D-alanine carboxypeptidase
MMKTNKSGRGILLSLMAILIILCIILFLFYCSTENRLSAGSTGSSPVVPPSEIDGELFPDLAEAIARFGGRAESDPDREAFVEDFWRWAFGEAGIPERFALRVSSSQESTAFILELLELLQQDPYTYRLVDKQHALPDGYEPDDLVALGAGSYRLGREGLMLRRAASEALLEMSAAAAAAGITLTVGSAYRSAEYQAEVYEREVRTYGREAADRESAQPGKSQHQLGLVVDFAPIDDIFAATQASEWLLRNAARFGWSLSYPDGYEQVTGYRWESWHYRFVGRDLAAFINSYFDGIQQYALQFIKAWQEQGE